MFHLKENKYPVNCYEWKTVYIFVINYCEMLLSPSFKYWLKINFPNIEHDFKFGVFPPYLSLCYKALFQKYS